MLVLGKRGEMNTTPRIGPPLVAALLVAACADLVLESDRVPTSMEISTHDLLIREGEAAKLEVVVRDQNGKVMRRPSWAPLTWEVENPAIAGVAFDGSVNARQGGETRVFVRMAGLDAATRIRVNPGEVALSAPLIYVTQGVQNRDGEVALIADRRALVRVFMVGDETSFYAPGVRVRMILEGREIFQQTFPPARDRTPTEIVESELDGSVNALIPAAAMRPGVRMVVELDPQGVVPLKSGSRTRYPESGSMALDVVQLQPFRHIIVPTINTSTGDESVVSWAEGLSVDHSYMNLLRSLLPVGEMELEIHEAYRTNLDGFDAWSEWLNDMVSLMEREGRRGYYYGASSQPTGGLLGVAYLAVAASVGVNWPSTHTHEVGHSMNLPHAPCGGPFGVDPNFPYPGAGIGVWGYDFFQSQLKAPSDFVDVMSYCDPVWISDYFFKRAITHRLSGDSDVVFDAEPEAAVAPDGDMLVVRGQIVNGELILEPSYVVSGPPALPDADGPYRVEGIGADGRTEFSYSFAPYAREHGGGGFVFLVPYRAEWAETLDRMVLTGPEGTDTMTRSSSPPMAVVTNPATGSIQAIIRDWDGGELPGEGVSIVQITRGIPTGERR